jgi:6-phosphogluconolactonase/glucosamine-6-phosphate isomerase/deaminase
MLKDGEYPRFDGAPRDGRRRPLPFPFPQHQSVTRLLTHRGSQLGRQAVHQRRILSAEAANGENRVIFLIARSDKAVALKALLEGPYEPEQLPAQLVQPVSGNLLGW